jgi:hypothetical protein
VESNADFSKAMLSILHLNDLPQIDVPGRTIPSQLLMQARDAVWDGKNEKANEVLAQAGLDKTTSAHLVIALGKPINNTTFSLVENQGEQQNLDGFGILQGESSLWMIKPDQLSDKTEVRPISTHEVTEKIKTLIGL